MFDLNLETRCLSQFDYEKQKLGQMIEVKVEDNSQFA